MKKTSKILSSIIITCILSPVNYSWCHSIKESRHTTVYTKIPDILKKKPLQEYMIDYGIENRLRLMLGKKYLDFTSNFQNTSAPSFRKDKSVFLTGFRDGETVLTGALLIKKDGRIYAAFYDEKENKINYYGPKNEEIPLVINMWRSDLLPHYDINEVDEEIRIIDSDTKENKNEKSIPLSGTNGAYDYEKFRQVMLSIWNANFLTQQHIQMNDAVVNVIANAEQEIFTCSKAMGFVPGLWFNQPGMLAKPFKTIIQEYVKQVIKNNWEIGHNNRYSICIIGAALTFKSALIDASLTG